MFYAKKGKYKNIIRVQFTLDENINRNEVYEFTTKPEVFAIEKCGEQIYIFFETPYNDIEDSINYLKDKYPKIQEAKDYLITRPIKYTKESSVPFIKNGVEADFLRR